MICFQFQEQRSLITTAEVEITEDGSCDLLSISGTTIFDNNFGTQFIAQCTVVICFQFQEQRSLITTN